MSADFTVRLEQVFQGPLDLLLHLVREQEVEIQEIEIARILDGYLAYLKTLDALDIEYAGDFLVMAATLMAIKSRSLLPREEVELEEELDPRDELIQRLLEYKRFKETAQGLEGLWHERAQLHERGYRSEAHELRDEPTLELGELTMWDLLTTFSRLMRETRAGEPHHVRADPRPLRYYVERMATLVSESGALSLRELVGGLGAGTRRENLVGCFCALLELVKLELVRATQDRERDDVLIEIRDEHRGDIAAVLQQSRLDDEDEPSAASAPGSPAESSEPDADGGAA